MNHFIDSLLVRWSVYYTHRFLDRSMGYPKSSPITRFGMPSRTGAVYDTNFTGDTGPSTHEAVQQLDPQDRLLLIAYYVKSGRSARKAAKLMECSDKTLTKRLCEAQSKLATVLNSALQYEL